MSEHSNPSNIYDRFAQVTKQTHDLVANMEQLQAQVKLMLNFQLKMTIYERC